MTNFTLVVGHQRFAETGRGSSALADTRDGRSREADRQCAPGLTPLLGGCALVVNANPGVIICECAADEPAKIFCAVSNEDGLTFQRTIVHNLPFWFVGFACECSHTNRSVRGKVRPIDRLGSLSARRRADQLAHLLGMDEDMIFTPAEYQCVIGTPPRDHDREIIFRCIYNLTNSNGNAAIPLSSYGLNVTEQGDVRSICAPCSPCLEFNALFGGPLEAIFAECGCLDKFLRVVAETPLLQLIEDANPCQEHGEPACLIETTCAGCGH